MSKTAPMIPSIIGITGLAGTGKDTLADYLSKNFGHEKYSLAKPLKEILNARFGWTMDMWDDREWKEDALRQMSGFSPRSWAQWLGTDVVRVLAGPDCWLDLMRDRWCMSDSEGLVIPDVRFDNEAEGIVSMGGVVVRVTRPGVAPVNSHVSEKGVRDEFISATIANDRNIGDFLVDACLVLRSLKEKV